MATRTTFGHAGPVTSSAMSRHARPNPTLVLDDLIRERASIEPIRVAVPHLWSLLDAEIHRLTAAAQNAKTAATFSSLAAGLTRGNYSLYSRRDHQSLAHQHPPMSKKRVKIPVPADKYPEYNFVGRLLGPRGTTLKTLEKDTGCKIMIRGKGSIRKDKEPEVRGKPGWEHVFHEALHVVIEVGDSLDESAAILALQRAKDAVEVLLVPVPEERDSLKRNQLRALAIMNGTYRGGNPARSLDSLPGLNAFSTSQPQAINYGMEQSATAVYLGESVAASVSHQLLPTQEEQNSLFRTMSHPYSRCYEFENVAFDRNPVKQTPAGRQSPSSGGTSPKNNVYDNVEGDNLSNITAKMQKCAVDEFASSSVGDDSPDSSPGSDDGEPSAQIIGGGYSGAQVKVASLSPGRRAETMVGVGGFLGQEFYNGAFSNGPAPNPWEQTAPSPQFSSGLYGFSPIPSPQVLTTSTTTVTPIQRHDGY